ncbi:MAG: hypothetical protein JWO90_1439, partial [Solirubrobacterales bacterium]|nr:hypothetical protein [Solirubrobacterales bacterium]
MRELVPALPAAWVAAGATPAAAAGKDRSATPRHRE